MIFNFWHMQDVISNHRWGTYIARSQETIGRRYFFVDAIEKKLQWSRRPDKKCIYICAIYVHAKGIKWATKPNI